MLKKIGFVTSVELGLSCMKAIYDSGNGVSLAITLPDNVATQKSGRVFIDEFCLKKKIPLFKNKHINNAEVINEIKKFKIDWLFIIGWSQVANSEIISAPTQGVIGAHPTLLPVGRGRSSIPWAILKDLSQTGVTLFKIDKGIDTGPIFSQKIVNLEKNETATSLYFKIKTAHHQIIKKFIPLLLKNQLRPLPQDEKHSSFWPARRPEDGEINFSKSVWVAERLIRAVTKPYPGAFYFEFKKKIIIWKASVSNDKPINEKFLQFKDGYLILIEFEIKD
jgi:methionyl-tRNA formyltransferase